MDDEGKAVDYEIVDRDGNFGRVYYEGPGEWISVSWNTGRVERIDSVGARDLGIKKTVC